MESSDAMSSAGYTSYSSDGGFGFTNPIPFSKGQVGEEDKRLFYSDAVSIKINLPLSHSGRDILIADMYNECLLRKINRDNF